MMAMYNDSAWRPTGCASCSHDEDCHWKMTFDLIFKEFRPLLLACASPFWSRKDGEKQLDELMFVWRPSCEVMLGIKSKQRCIS